MITLTLWSSNELRVDHKLVKAESQTQFDFNDKNEWKERKNTYKRSPQALISQVISGMKWLALQLGDIAENQVWVLQVKGGGYL